MSAATFLWTLCMYSRGECRPGLASTCYLLSLKGIHKEKPETKDVLQSFTLLICHPIVYNNSVESFRRGRLPTVLLARSIREQQLPCFIAPATITPLWPDWPYHLPTRVPGPPFTTHLMSSSSSKNIVGERRELLNNSSRTDRMMVTLCWADR